MTPVPPLFLTREKVTTVSTARDYLVRVELDSRNLSTEDVDAIHASLDDWKVSAAENLAGFIELTLTIPAERLRQAVDTALTLSAEFGYPTAVYGIDHALADRRDGLEQLPAVVSVPEAAEILKVTRQYVLQLISEGRLPATKVARDHVIVKSALGPFISRDGATTT